jgi:antitoxin component YwqK of YwqJK toxin-antitoxin module
MTHPCIQYEFNEAWIFSDAGDISPESTGGTVRSYRETYPDGTVRATWTARICQKGRYLLDGLETTYYPDGQKEHQTTYVNGRKKGEETFWAPDGAKLWSWKHDPEHNSSVWVHYWHDGGKRIESRWQTESKARDLDRKFIGLVAEGPAFHWNPDGKLVHAYSFTNGGFTGPLPLESQSAAIKVAGKERGDGEGK